MSPTEAVHQANLRRLRRATAKARRLVEQQRAPARRRPRRPRKLA